MPLKYLLPTAWLLLLPAIATAAEPLTVVPVDGGPFQAALVAADAHWQLTFDADGRRREMPAGELVSFGTFVETVRGPVLVLADGGLIVADVLRADKDRLVVDSRPFGPIELPVELIAGVVFRPPTRRHDRDLLIDRVARAAGHTDLIILTGGDEITGSFHSISEHTVRLDAEERLLEVDTDRVSAVVFNPVLLQRADHQGIIDPYTANERRATNGSPASRHSDLDRPIIDHANINKAWAGFRDGSRLLATRLVLAADSLEITISGGRTLKTAAEELVGLQPLGGRVTYLSDLKPAGYRHLPFLDLHWPYRTDRNVLGGRLRSGGKLYLKGLGVHSAARLTYQLGRPYKRFQASLGVDDHTSGRGSVRFRVFVDGRQKHASQTVRGGDPPLNVSVDLTGAKRIDLVVDYADHADELDHADWLDARLVR